MVRIANQLFLALLIAVTVFHLAAMRQSSRLRDRDRSVAFGVRSFPEEVEMNLTAGERDPDWFMAQRCYPYNDVPQKSFQGMRAAMKTFAAAAAKQPRKINDLSGSWSFAGPTNIGGRVSALIITPPSNEIFAGAASGGVWKSTDFGSTWTLVFNEAYSTGALAYNPQNPSEIFVGTGEANAAGSPMYPGNGLWRTTDDGGTWTSLGLASTGHIGKIVINPLNPNTIYLSSIGLYRSRTADRGIYKSTDHGTSWTKILYINDTTGAADVVLDTDTNRVIATTWTRYRPLWYSIIGGPGSAIYFSINAGTSWAKAGGSPNNDATIGRISLAAAPSNPAILYALVADASGGWKKVLRSANHGQNWAVSFNNTLFNTSSESQVWYNNIMLVDPLDPNIVWAGMTHLYKSTNGGSSFSFYGISGSSHVDYHAMSSPPSMGPDTLVFGNDGGIFISSDQGGTWWKSPNLPITQFYAGIVDPQDPTVLFGGTQDNSTMRTYGNNPDGWYIIYGGDGFTTLMDPTDENYVYAEYQYGAHAYSTDGGTTFFDGNNGINQSEQANWSVPVAMDLQHPKTLYTGTTFLYRTTDNMQNWTKISPDLTYDKGGFLGTVSAIDVSKSNSDVIYAGSGDGRMWYTADGGSTWHDISLGLPSHYITRVTIDREFPNDAYVTLSGFREYDFQGHIYHTTDYGSTWTNIGGSLPDIPVNDLVIDPLDRSTLYVATDLNVLYSTDAGTAWNVLGNNFPQVPVHNLSLHEESRTLAAFTHGRSVYTYVLPVANQVRVQCALQPRWNMISNPFTADNDLVHALFPGALTDAYSLGSNQGYIQDVNLLPGCGYWLKFANTTGLSQTLMGSPVSTRSISVRAGWNMIGSLSSDIPTSNISAVGTTVLSQYYTYTGSYTPSTVISAGKGYWVKVDNDGQLVLNASAASAKFPARNIR